MLLHNKVILVTGAGSGIGRGTSKVLAREGAILFLTDINSDSLQETIKLIDSNEKIESLVVDVSKENDLKLMMETIVLKFGRIDGAFNNAGISGPSSEFKDYDDLEFDKIIQTDLKSVWTSMKLQINQMLKQETKGAIINTASIGGLVGKPGISAYIAAKHGVVGLTKTASLEYGKKGIRINAVCPGIIRTEMLDQLIKSGTMGTEEEWAHLQPIGRLGTTEEIGEFVAWALSDKASLLHGQSIALDGGFTSS